MTKSTSHSVDYIATALACVVLLLLLVWAMCAEQVGASKKPVTSKQTKQRLTNLEAKQQQIIERLGIEE